MSFLSTTYLSKYRFGRKRRGVTLIEISLVFILIGIVLVGALATYNAVQDRQLENNTKALVQTLVSGTKALYSGSTDYDAIGTTAAALPKFLRDGKKVPGNYINTSVTSNIISPFNTEVRVQAHADNTFSIQLDNTPTNICNSLLAEYAASRAALAANVGTLALSGTAWTTAQKELDITATSGSKQWTVANISGQCDDATIQDVSLLFQ